MDPKGKGLVYLIQPAELVGTNRYKIGCSAKNDLERPRKGYKKGSRFICIMECSNPFKVETKIKEHFNLIFTLVAGHEYFEGHEDDIKKEFLNIVTNFKEEIVDTLEPGSLNNDSEEEEEKKEETLIIDSWELYKIYSKSNIRNIIITKKTKPIGYLQFDNQEYRLLTDPASREYDTNIHETLKDFISLNQQSSIRMRNKITGLVEEWLPYSSYSNHIVIWLKYDTDKIVKDIITQCYTEHYEEYILKHHEFIVHSTNDIGRSSVCKILNTLSYEFMYLNDIIQDKITRFKASIVCINTSIIDSTIVEEIMTQLLPDSLYREHFKYTMKCIFKIKLEQTVIFEDIYSRNEYAQLSSWVNGMYHALTGYSDSYINLKGSLNVSDNNKILKKFIKENKHHPPRFVIIQGAYEFEKEKIIVECKGIGINVFIIQEERKNSKYNYTAYSKYMTDNYEKVISQCSDLKISEYEQSKLSDKEHVDDIFYSKRMLFSHFMKWCLT